MENIERRKKYLKLKAILIRHREREKVKFALTVEKHEKVGPYKIRIPSFTKTCLYRIPDILTENELIDIKNVKRLGYSNQLKDFLHYCNNTNRKFIIVTRNDVILTKKLSALINCHQIEILYLSPLLSTKFQKEFGEFLSESRRKYLSRKGKINKNYYHQINTLSAPNNGLQRI
jgi:hypothetical protein